MLTADIENLLKTTPLVITIGNDLRGDDGVGPYIYNACQTAGAKCRMMNAGDKPENILGREIDPRPGRIVIIDAADFGGRAGEVRMIDRENIPETTLSTHTFPLRVVAGILEEDIKAPVYFLGIQPKGIGLGEGLSPEVKRAAEEIIKCMKCTC